MCGAGLEGLEFGEVWEGVKGVWGSQWNERAWLSRQAMGLAEEQLRMACVIQPVVPANYAFVLHTANPLTGDKDQMLGEVRQALCPFSIYKQLKYCLYTKKLQQIPPPGGLNNSLSLFFTNEKVDGSDSNAHRSPTWKPNHVLQVGYVEGWFSPVHAENTMGASLLCHYMRTWG